MIVFLTKDLFFVPVLQSAASRQGSVVQVLLSVDSPKAAELPAEDVVTCVVDLSGVPPGEMPQVVDRLRERFPQARIAAFGPHVQEGRLLAAREAGCEKVLTRGQFNAQVDRWVAAWSQPVSVDG